MNDGGNGATREPKHGYRTTIALLALAAATSGCGGTGSASGPLPQALAQAIRVSRPATLPTAPASGAPGVSLPLPSAAPQRVVYPVYSSYFRGKTPFHDSVVRLMAAGATVLPAQIARNYWAQTVNSNDDPTGASEPMNYIAPGDPAVTFVCREYGTCNADGMKVHYRPGTAASTDGDHHLISFDPVYGHEEVDGWGGDPAHPCAVTSTMANCSWGGVFPFSGSGLATDSSGGNAAGYAFGLYQVSAQELLDGHIDHALGLIQSCLDAGGIYPATPGRNTDSACPANLEPNAAYGNLIHVKASVNVAALGYSPYCREIVQALQTYGGYTVDNNGGWGIAVALEDVTDPAYVTAPWQKTIMPSMVAGGDATGSDASFRFSSCLQRLGADDIEVIAISPNLP